MTRPLRIFADPRPYASCGVYRLYDAAGVLLYIGSAVDPRSRASQHVRSKEWGAQIATVVIQWYGPERVARLAEQRAIRDEAPLHNVVRYRAAA